MKIICDINAFTMNQSVRILNDNNQLVGVEGVSMDRLPATIFALAEKMNIENIFLSGEKTFTQKTKENLELESAKIYGVSGLNIKLI